MHWNAPSVSVGGSYVILGRESGRIDIWVNQSHAANELCKVQIFIMSGVLAIRHRGTNPDAPQHHSVVTGSVCLFCLH